MSLIIYAILIVSIRSNEDSKTRIIHVYHRSIFSEGFQDYSQIVYDITITRKIFDGFIFDERTIRNDRVARKLQGFRCSGGVFGILMYVVYNSCYAAVVAYLLLIALSRFVFKTIRISIENSWTCHIDAADHMSHPVVPSSIHPRPRTDYYQVYTHTIILFSPSLFFFKPSLYTTGLD